MTDDIAFLPATELIALYRDKKLSPVEVMAETLRRLERFEAALNAFVLYDPEAAMAQARASEARWRKGEPLGLLDGVPVAIKDTVLTTGWPRLVGSRTIDPNQAWNEDSPVTERLRAHGAVLFGKTTTPEFGWKPLTDSPLSGVTRNPWDLERTPGGSSGGSAAAVLAGICPLAVGTDAGGSIRIPAAFSGIFGLKPSFGRVAVYPPSAFGDVAHVGPMARTVEDAALMLDAIKGPDSRDWHSFPDDGVAHRERLQEGSLRGKRVALSMTLGLAEPEPQVRAAIEARGRGLPRPRCGGRACRSVPGTAKGDFRAAGVRGVLGPAARLTAGGAGSYGSRARRSLPARRNGDAGGVCRGGDAAGSARADIAAVFRSLRPTVVADDADPGCLCRST